MSDQPSTETPRRDLRVTIEDEARDLWQEWMLRYIIGAPPKAQRWAIFLNGEFIAMALWRPDRLAWEPVPSASTQPSDSMLRVFHVLIGEAFPVERTVLP